MRTLNLPSGFVLLLLLIFLSDCDDQLPVNPPPAVTTEVESSPSATSYDPVPFPDPGIPGFRFPEDSTVINDWVENRDEDAIYRHVWGIWAGLTQKVGFTCSGDSLRVFETWDDPEYLADRMQGKPLSKSATLACGRPPLTVPTQLIHQVMQTNTTVGVNDSIFESVVYSPAAADYALSKKIFSRVELDRLYAAGERNLAFPHNSITAKPVFKIIPRRSIDVSPYPIEVWPGATLGPDADQKAMPEDNWNNFVYVTNSQGTHPDFPPNSLFNLTDFIHFELTASDTAYFESDLFDGDQKDIQVGDYAILVGMHVSTREILRWTWQSFYWTPNPEQPDYPSSSRIAALRPAALTGPARHYAVSAGYNMVWPAQPAAGGQSTGEPVYSFNPYLEAGFGAGVFRDTARINAGTLTEIKNVVGIRTNCMSCHIRATYTPSTSTAKGENPYAANAYVSMDDKFFRGRLMTDFAYSVGATLYPKKKTGDETKQ